MTPQVSREWRRLHRVDLVGVVALSVVASPIAGWIVRVEGWSLPRHFVVVYAELETAQRAADDVLTTHVPHDCRLSQCREWVPFVAPPLTAPEAPM